MQYARAKIEYVVVHEDPEGLIRGGGSARVEHCSARVFSAAPAT